MNTEKSILNPWWLVIILSLIWGCSFILIKKSLIAFTPNQLACLRLSISSLAFSPIVWSNRKEIPWNMLLKFFIVGATGSGIPAFLFFAAQTQLSSSVAGLLNSLTPIWTLLLGVTIFKSGITSNKITGVIIGFLGAASLLLMGDERSLGGNPLYGGLIVLATFCYGLSVSLVESSFKGVRPLLISAVSFFTIGPPAMIYLFSTDFIEILTTNPDAQMALLSVTTLSLFGTVFASILFYYLVQRTSAVFGSSVTFLMPIVAFGWGLADGEVLDVEHITAMVLILVGVYLIKK